MNLKNSADTSPAFLGVLQIVMSADGARVVLIHYLDAPADPTTAEREILRSLSKRDGLRVAVVRTAAHLAPENERAIQIWTDESEPDFVTMSLDEFSSSVEKFLGGSCD